MLTKNSFNGKPFQNFQERGKLLSELGITQGYRKFLCYRIQDAESAMHAAGFDQFSNLFNCDISQNAPAPIESKLENFARDLALEKLPEYLALAQKCRLFYQDPAIIDKLKPVETMHDPFTAQRNIHSAFKYEGKSGFQEKPWLIWDWEIDNPAPERWVRNLISNFMDRTVQDLYEQDHIGVQSLFRTQNYDFNFGSTMHIKGERKKTQGKQMILNIDTHVDRLYCDISKARP